MDDAEQYDAIVIGSGPIGAHVARDLADRHKARAAAGGRAASGLSYEGYRSYVDAYSPP